MVDEMFPWNPKAKALKRPRAGAALNTNTLADQAQDAGLSGELLNIRVFGELTQFYIVVKAAARSRARLRALRRESSLAPDSDALGAHP